MSAPESAEDFARVLIRLIARGPDIKKVAALIRARDRQISDERFDPSRNQPAPPPWKLPEDLRASAARGKFEVVDEEP